MSSVGHGPLPETAADVKQCCASLYGSDAARLLLGNSFHPGGVALTHELATRLQLGPDSKVLDVACGCGTSALALAETFNCEVVGVDLSEANVRSAREQAQARKLVGRARFEVSDAEALHYPDGSFDAVLCECAFCTFPSKGAAAAELYRVLKPGGRLGVSDLTRQADALTEELYGLLAWISCIADAQPMERYTAWLTGAGFTDVVTQDRSVCLMEMAQRVRGKLGVVEIMIALKKLELPGWDLAQAKGFARAAIVAIEKGQLGYGILVAHKRAADP